MSNQEILERPLTNLHHKKLQGKHITTLHRWWRRRLTSNGVCVDCGAKPKWLDLANISGEYKNEATDWKYLCRSCHRKFDKRRTNYCRNGHQYTKENTYTYSTGARSCITCRKEAHKRWKAKQTS